MHVQTFSTLPLKLRLQIAESKLFNILISKSVHPGHAALLYLQTHLMLCNIFDREDFACDPTL